MTSKEALQALRFKISEIQDGLHAIQQSSEDILTIIDLTLSKEEEPKATKQELSTKQRNYRDDRLTLLGVLKKVFENGTFSRADIANDTKYVYTVYKTVAQERWDKDNLDKTQIQKPKTIKSYVDDLYKAGFLTRESDTQNNRYLYRVSNLSSDEVIAAIARLDTIFKQCS